MVALLHQGLHPCALPKEGATLNVTWPADTSRANTCATRPHCGERAGVWGRAAPSWGWFVTLLPGKARGVARVATWRSLLPRVQRCSGYHGAGRAPPPWRCPRRSPPAAWSSPRPRWRPRWRRRPAGSCMWAAARSWAPAPTGPGCRCGWAAGRGRPGRRGAACPAGWSTSRTAPGTAACRWGAAGGWGGCGHGAGKVPWGWVCPRQGSLRDVVKRFWRVPRSGRLKIKRGKAGLRWGGGWLWAPQDKTGQTRPVVGWVGGFGLLKNTANPVFGGISGWVWKFLTPEGPQEVCAVSVHSQTSWGKGRWQFAPKLFNMVIKVLQICHKKKRFCDSAWCYSEIQYL